MAYEIGKLVKADSTLNTAVQNALSIGEKLSPDNRPRIQRNSMMESDTQVAGVYEYSSYFKITNASETSADGTVIHKISIVDGYDRGYNRCKVNNKVYDLKYHTETITATSLIALRFNASEKKVEYYISAENILPDDTSEYSYCQIGIVAIKDSVMEIKQDHLCGIAQMFWYDVCGD